jgi:hypothetical protein
MCVEMTARDEIAAIRADQQDDSAGQELLRELVFAQMVDRGFADSDAGRSSLEQRDRGMP